MRRTCKVSCHPSESPAAAVCPQRPESSSRPESHRWTPCRRQRANAGQDVESEMAACACMTLYACAVDAQGGLEAGGGGGEVAGKRQERKRRRPCRRERRRAC